MELKLTFYKYKGSTVSVFLANLYADLQKGILPKLSVDFVYIHTEYEKQPPKVLYKKPLLIIFAIFAGKHMR